MSVYSFFQQSIELVTYSNIIAFQVKASNYMDALQKLEKTVGSIENSADIKIIGNEQISSESTNTVKLIYFDKKGNPLKSLAETEDRNKLLENVSQELTIQKLMVKYKLTLDDILDVNKQVNEKFKDAYELIYDTYYNILNDFIELMSLNSKIQ